MQIEAINERQNSIELLLRVDNFKALAKGLSMNLRNVKDLNCIFGRIERQVYHC